MDEVVPRRDDRNDIMPDRTNQYPVVKNIENTDDKVVVHWRYVPELRGGNPHTGVRADGLNALGQAGFKLIVNGVWEKITTMNNEIL